MSPPPERVSKALVTTRRTCFCRYVFGTFKIRSARLRLFGHIARAEPPLELGSLVRESPPSTWSRPRGRPRRTYTWTDLLSADLQAAGLDITSAWVAARDRKTWRAEWRLHTSLARLCTGCKSVVCTPRLAVSGCVHRSLREWLYGTHGTRASLVLSHTGGESADRT
ncbi:hypothetical protein Bbelb_268040 [Branchiostoma belcheri]|nr:hypothetical protein Bbelb_268040 [Branchiostoma belcheri]